MATTLVSYKTQLLDLCEQSRIKSYDREIKALTRAYFLSLKPALDNIYEEHIRVADYVTLLAFSIKCTEHLQYINPEFAADRALLLQGCAYFTLWLDLFKPKTDGKEKNGQYRSYQD